jgi:hypothetical protein
MKLRIPFRAIEAPFTTLPGSSEEDVAGNRSLNPSAQDEPIGTSRALVRALADDAWVFPVDLPELGAVVGCHVWVVSCKFDLRKVHP